MGHPAKSISNNGGTIGFNSLYPDGDAAPPATGLKLVGAVAHGNIVTIMSGSDIDFGSVAPDLLFCFNMENMTAGSNLTLTKGSTFDSSFVSRAQYLQYTGAYTMPIHSVPEMPFGVGFPYGDLNSYPSGLIMNPKMEAKAIRKYSSFYRFSYQLWPAANQANQLALHAAGEQVKTFGDQFENGFSLTGDQSKIDAYQGIFGVSGTGSTMSSAQALEISNSSSFGGSQTSDKGATISGGCWYFPATSQNASAVISSGLNTAANTSMNIKIDDTHQRSSLICYETFLVSGAVDIRADCRVIDTAVGCIADISDTARKNPLCTNTKFDRFDTPKNVQGHNVPNNKHFYVNGTIQLVSEVEGAASRRVMISDTPTPSALTRGLSMCVHMLWTPHLLKIKINAGMFFGGSLSGKYLVIYGAYNTILGSILIP